jgi:hypothetical protein
MLEKLTARLLWDQHLSPRWQRVWGVLILLAPLALAGAIFLQWTAQSKLPVRVTLDRSEAREIARKVLDDRGFNVMGWNETVRTETEGNIYRYLIRQGTPGRQAIERLGLWSRVIVQFVDTQMDQKAEVTLSPTGAVLGYRVTLGDSQEPAAPLPAAEASVLIEKARDELLSPFPFLRRTTSESTREADTARSSNRWKVGIEGLTDLELSAVIGIRGRQITESSITAELSSEAERRVREPSNRISRGIFLVYVSILSIYLIVRYFKRRYQGEVSRQRMLLVTLLVGAFVAGLVLLGDAQMKISDNDGAIPPWLPIFLISIAAYLSGQLAGLGYAASEGDLRETRPRMLTSLDALLSGKLLSRNVGRSVVLGVVLLSWMTLAERLAEFGSRPEFPLLGTFEDSHQFLFSRLPWLSLFLSAAYISIFVSLVGVMTPFSTLARRWKGKRWIYVPLILFAVVTIDFLMAPPVFGVTGWIVRIVYTAALLISFFHVDLLASIVMVAGHSFAEAIVGLSQMAPGWDDQNKWALLIAGLTLVAQTAAAFRGRVVDEDEVRPRYATEIHERLQLESEVEAAKEAQLRLLPSGPPDIPGLTLSASCRATEKVSGDFFDFFPISRTKLGVLVCDGGGNGLATALTIALAKGYLMHKAQCNATPLETLRGLEATLGEQLKGISAEGICYFVLDAAEGSVRYARYGDTPSMLLMGGGELSHETQHLGTLAPLWEGSANLADASRLIVYTNGLSRLVGEPDRPATNRWLLKRIGGLIWQPAEQLHDSIVKAIFTRKGRMGARKATDDVTVIVCSVDCSAAQSVERVA